MRLVNWFYIFYILIMWWMQLPTTRGVKDLHTISDIRSSDGGLYDLYKKKLEPTFRALRSIESNASQPLGVEKERQYKEVLANIENGVYLPSNWSKRQQLLEDIIDETTGLCNFFEKKYKRASDGLPEEEVEEINNSLKDERRNRDGNVIIPSLMETETYADKSKELGTGYKVGEKRAFPLTRTINEMNKQPAPISFVNSGGVVQMAGKNANIGNFGNVHPIQAIGIRPMTVQRYGMQPMAQQEYGKQSVDAQVNGTQQIALQGSGTQPMVAQEIFMKPTFDQTTGKQPMVDYVNKPDLIGNSSREKFDSELKAVVGKLLTGKRQPKFIYDKTKRALVANTERNEWRTFMNRRLYGGEGNTNIIEGPSMNRYNNNLIPTDFDIQQKQYGTIPYQSSIYKHQESIVEDSLVPLVPKTDLSKPLSIKIAAKPTTDDRGANVNNSIINPNKYTVEVECKLQPSNPGSHMKSEKDKPVWRLNDASLKRKNISDCEASKEVNLDSEQREVVDKTKRKPIKKSVIERKESKSIVHHSENTVNNHASAQKHGQPINGQERTSDNREDSQVNDDNDKIIGEYKSYDAVNRENRQAIKNRVGIKSDFSSTRGRPNDREKKNLTKTHEALAKKYNLNPLDQNHQQLIEDHEYTENDHASPEQQLSPIDPREHSTSRDHDIMKDSRLTKHHERVIKRKDLRTTEGQEVDVDDVQPIGRAERQSGKNSENNVDDNQPTQPHGDHIDPNKRHTTKNKDGKDDFIPIQCHERAIEKLCALKDMYEDQKNSVPLRHPLDPSQHYVRSIDGKERHSTNDFNGCSIDHEDRTTKDHKNYADDKSIQKQGYPIDRRERRSRKDIGIDDNVPIQHPERIINREKCNLSSAHIYEDDQGEQKLTENNESVESAPSPTQNQRLLIKQEQLQPSEELHNIENKQPQLRNNRLHTFDEVNAIREQAKSNQNEDDSLRKRNLLKLRAGKELSTAQSESMKTDAKSVVYVKADKLTPKQKQYAGKERTHKPRNESEKSRSTNTKEKKKYANANNVQHGLQLNGSRYTKYKHQERQSKEFKARDQSNEDFNEDNVFHELEYETHAGAKSEREKQYHIDFDKRRQVEEDTHSTKPSSPKDGADNPICCLEEGEERVPDDLNTVPVKRHVEDEILRETKQGSSKSGDKPICCLADTYADDNLVENPVKYPEHLKRHVEVENDFDGKQVKNLKQHFQEQVSCSAKSATEKGDVENPICSHKDNVASASDDLPVKNSKRHFENEVLRSTMPGSPKSGGDYPVCSSKDAEQETFLGDLPIKHPQRQTTSDGIDKTVKRRIYKNNNPKHSDNEYDANEGGTVHTSKRQTHSQEQQPSKKSAPKSGTNCPNCYLSESQSHKNNDFQKPLCKLHTENNVLLSTKEEKELYDTADLDDQAKRARLTLSPLKRQVIQAGQSTSKEVVPKIDTFTPVCCVMHDTEKEQPNKRSNEHRQKKPHRTDNDYDDPTELLPNKYEYVYDEDYELNLPNQSCSNNHKREKNQLDNHVVLSPSENNSTKDEREKSFRYLKEAIGEKRKVSRKARRVTFDDEAIQSIDEVGESQQPATSEPKLVKRRSRAKSLCSRQSCLPKTELALSEYGRDTDNDLTADYDYNNGKRSIAPHELTTLPQEDNHTKRQPSSNILLTQKKSQGTTESKHEQHETCFVEKIDKEVDKENLAPLSYPQNRRRKARHMGLRSYKKASRPRSQTDEPDCAFEETQPSYPYLSPAESVSRRHILYKKVLPDGSDPNFNNDQPNDATVSKDHCVNAGSFQLEGEDSSRSRRDTNQKILITSAKTSIDDNGVDKSNSQEVNTYTPPQARKRSSQAIDPKLQPAEEEQPAEKEHDSAVYISTTGGSSFPSIFSTSLNTGTGLDLALPITNVLPNHDLLESVAKGMNVTPLKLAEKVAAMSENDIAKDPQMCTAMKTYLIESLQGTTRENLNVGAKAAADIQVGINDARVKPKGSIKANSNVKADANIKTATASKTGSNLRAAADLKNDSSIKCNAKVTSISNVKPDANKKGATIGLVTPAPATATTAHSAIAPAASFLASNLNKHPVAAAPHAKLPVATKPPKAEPHAVAPAKLPASAASTTNNSRSQKQTSEKKTFSDKRPDTESSMPSQSSSNSSGLSIPVVADKVFTHLEKMRCDYNEEPVVEGAPCDIAGTWDSVSLGLQFDISAGRSLERNLAPAEALNKAVTVVMRECSASKMPSFLDKDWKIMGSAMNTRGGPIFLYAQKHSEPRIATFVGRCRICGGIDTIFGTWTYDSHTTNCHDVSTSPDRKSDVLRRHVVKTKKRPLDM